MNAVEAICGRCLMLRDGSVEMLDQDVHGVVRHYLESNDSHSCGPVWRNSGALYQNPWFTPQTLEITGDGASENAGYFHRGEIASVEIIGQVSEKRHNLQVGYGLFSADNTLLYWTTCTDSPEEQWTELTLGNFRFRSALPLHLLNLGEYRVELFLGLHHQKWIAEPGVTAPSVSFSIIGKLSDSPHWIERRPGVLAPQLGWRVSSINPTHDR